MSVNSKLLTVTAITDSFVTKFCTFLHFEWEGFSKTIWSLPSFHTYVKVNQLNLIIQKSFKALSTSVRKYNEEETKWTKVDRKFF